MFIDAAAGSRKSTALLQQKLTRHGTTACQRHEDIEAFRVISYTGEAAAKLRGLDLD